jgi:hypothetical protein
VQAIEVIGEKDRRGDYSRTYGPCIISDVYGQEAKLVRRCFR